MPPIEKEPIYEVYCISRRKHLSYLNIRFWGCLSGAVGSVDVLCCTRRSVKVVGSNLARGKIFTASIGSDDSLCVNLHQFLILCSSKAMMFVKLYFPTSDIYLISLLSLDPSSFHLRKNRCYPLKRIRRVLHW